MISDETSGNPINRAYVYLLNQTTSDTLAGPLFAGSDGVLDAIANLDNGPDLDLSILYRKSGYTNFEGTASVSLPDTLTLNTTLQSAPAPTASFTVSGDQRINTPLIFDASASTGAQGENLTYSWDFGNGKRGFGEVISFVYGTNDHYTVTLTVSGEFGSTSLVSEELDIRRSPFAPPITIISGEITTIDQTPLAGVTAQVVNNELESISGTDGRIIIPDIPIRGPIVVKLTKEGYATQTVRITPDDQNDENFIIASMLPLEDPVKVSNIEAGTNVIGKFGTRVSLPVDGLVDSNGDVVTGDVELSMTPLDVSSDEIFAFPGGFDGLRSTGELGSLISFGVADFTFTQDGEILQMMPGKSAEIEIPVTNQDVELGDTIPLWTLDEETGLWIEEGTGEIISSSESLSGLAMITRTGHFSWKNIDAFIEVTGFESETYTLIPQCISTQSDQAINCTLRGRLLNEDGTIAGFARTNIIPADIETRQVVPINKTFQIEAIAGFNAPMVEVTIPPVSDPEEVIRVTFEFSPRTVSNEIPIAYGDVIIGKVIQSEVSRYVFEGEAGDFIKIRVGNASNFDGSGQLTLLNQNEEVQKEGFYRNNSPAFLFETLSESGTYYIDILTENEESRIDIGLELIEGPVNRSIKYGDRLSDFLFAGTTNTYTFYGQTEEVFELIARNVPGEGGLFANLRLNTPDVNVSYDIQFFDYNVWIKRLEEKDGVFTFEVNGVEQSSNGVYILDFNTTEIFKDSGSEIAYGDSIIGKVTQSEPTNTFTFEGNAGDRIRLHFDKPYSDEESNRLSLDPSLLSPDSEVLYEYSDSFRFRDDFGFGFILPSDGTYSINIEADNIETPDAEGELFSLLLIDYKNPSTKDLDDDSIDLKNEVYATGLNLNEYTLSGREEDFSRLVVRSTDGGFRSQGNVMLFDENYQFLLEDSFFGGRSGARSIFDFETTDQQYTVIVTNPGRIQESFGRVAYAVDINGFNGGFIEFNTPLSTTLEPNELKVFSFKNESVRNEVSIAALGFDDIEVPVYIVDPLNNRPRLFFNGSQSDSPTILEDRTNYLLYTKINDALNVLPIQLSVVDLRPPSIISIINDGTTSVDGAIRVNGDIDRFSLRDYANGTLKVSILPAESNSIDNSGNLKLRILDARDSVVVPDFEDPTPDGPELYIWEARIGSSVKYQMSIWDQSAILTGNFIVKAEFTTGN